jgi:endonuclease/exonuclease/phosphatase family metal-dependent hydrolase
MVFHGNVSSEIAKGIKELRRRINGKIPPMTLDETLNIATWNIREFGKKRRSEAAIHFIAEIIWQFSLVAIVELRDNLEDLRRVMTLLGPNWEVLFSDFNADPQGNRERIGYLYDTRAVTPTGLAAEADPPRIQDPVTKEYVPKITFWRSPYLATFRCGTFDFMLLAAHVRWDNNEAASRLRELDALASWIHDRDAEKYVEDKDIIVLGDFNIPDTQGPMFKAITKYGLQMPRALIGAHGSNLEQNKRYDQILHQRKYPTSPDKGGVLDFYTGDWTALFQGKEFRATTHEEFTFQMSDHLPLWIHLDTWVADAKLDEIITRGRRT